jgi:hypothetical protein
MTDIFSWRTEAGASILVTRVERGGDLGATLRAMGLALSRPVLVIVGGAGGLDEAAQVRLRSLFVEGLAPLAARLDVTVVDGGTDAGVMRLMGEARTEIGGTFPLVGVAPAGKAAIPGDPSATEGHRLEPRHSHIVLVPESTWADGAPWIADVASAIAGSQPSVTVLIDGGEVSWTDAQASLAAGRPVIVVAGTGRVADELASAGQGSADDRRAAALIASGQLIVVDFADGLGAVAAAVDRVLAGVR